MRPLLAGSPRLFTLVFSGYAAFASLACSGATTTTGAPAPVDGGVDSARMVDATPPSDAVADSAVCEVGDAPAGLGDVTSKVVIADADGGGLPPAATGGDEAGLWAYSHITLYLTAAANGQVDAAASTIKGKGYIELKAGKYRQSVQTQTTIVVQALGAVARGGDTRSKGAYVEASGKLTFTPECSLAQADLAPRSFGFSRLTATTARMIVASETQLGPTTIVTELTKVD